MQDAVYGLLIVAKPEAVCGTNSLGMTFVQIEPGTFIMGSPESELGRNSDETQHQVTLTKGFCMQTTEVTQGQWKAVMGSNPSEYQSGGDFPVERVSWANIQDFITKLNQRGEGTYRLPTEAEWEYAARAGSTTALANGEITEVYCEYDPNLKAMAWYCTGETHPVAQKQANAWGLYDMYGNVCEWCQDYFTYGYGEDVGAVTDPTGPLWGTLRVVRGGSHAHYAHECRSAARGGVEPGCQYHQFGFRLLRTP